ncbi:MAG: type II toxin-antitoxin system PemK/MazF family toxin [Anaerolineaceae bacterium]|nr:type II toxin-antitoxin system PemK/MazF family toxin [Anaerolineaceae bacterium]
MKRGEIWKINLDPTIGAEIRKTRPGIIISVDAVGILPLRVIIPIAEWKDRYKIASWMVRLDPDDQNHLQKVSAADTFQVRSISTSRFVELVGTISEEKTKEIELALAEVLGIHFS